MPTNFRRSRMSLLAKALAGSEALPARAGRVPLRACIAVSLLLSGGIARAADPPVDASKIADDDRVIRRHARADERAAGAAVRKPAGTIRLDPVLPTGWLAPVFLVLGLGATLWTLRRRARGLPGGGRTQMLDVIGRVPLSPRQTLYLVRIGRRVVLLGATSDQVRTLIDVHDPVEAAEIVGAAAQARGGSLSSQFTEFLKTAAAPFREAEPAAVAAAPRSVDEARGGIDRLRQQVRGYAVNAAG